MRTPLVGVSLLGLLLLAGCRQEPRQAPGPHGAGEPPRRPSVEDLRALPYAGYTAQKADPSKRGVVALDRTRTQPGYTLVTHRNLCTAELLSATGRTVQSWRMAGPCRHWARSELLEDGDLLVVGMEKRGGGRSSLERRFLSRLSWNGEPRWTRRVPAHHDADPLPGGGFLALTAGYREEPDFEGTLYDNALTRLDSEGRVIEEVSVYRLFRTGPFPFTLQVPKNSQRKDRVASLDLFHLNSVEWSRFPALSDRFPLFAEGNVLVSSRHQDAMAILKWSTRELLWAWGPGEISGPHDATWLPTGRLLIFDNGLGRGWSRVVEVDPASGEIAWQYRAAEPESFFTVSRGSAQRLENGNTLIAQSDAGRAFEVTPAGEIVWEYLSPHLDERGRRATIVRARRHPVETIDALRNLSP